MALTPEEEKFVSDLFVIHKKKQQIDDFAKQRQQEEEALILAYKVDELNTLRANLASTYAANTVNLINEVKNLEKDLAK